MMKALIIGLSGNFGSQMAKSLKDRDWTISALMRTPTKAPEWVTSDEIISGDANNKEEVLKASRHCDVIIFAASPAYHRWEQEFMGLLEPAIQVAEQLGIRILLPANVYNYQPKQKMIDEQTAQVPITNKGELRASLEQRLFDATKKGAKVTIIRAGDFLGENTHQSWLNFILKKEGTGYRLSLPHNQQHIHQWAYLPDVCDNTALLLEQAKDDFETWHDPGLKLQSQDWLDAFSANKLTVQLDRFPWWLYKVLAYFNPILKEVVKMSYLWRDNVLLNGDAMQQKLGKQMVSTPFTRIIDNILIKKHLS